MSKAWGIGNCSGRSQQQRIKLYRNLALVFLLWGGVPVWAATDPIELKVGITEYQNIDHTYESYLHFFRDTETASNNRLRFAVAVGTYDEVLKWRDQGNIDLAVLSALPVTTLLSRGNSDDRRELADEYLGHFIYVNSSKNDEASTLDLVDSDHSKPRVDGYYRTMCVVREASPFHSLQDIVKAANEQNGNVRFLFVRPYSVSGYIHPRYVLERAGLRQNSNNVNKVVDAEFTMQHANSLNILLDPKEKDVKKDLVAFVLSQTHFDKNRVNELRRIPIPELEETKIPQEGLFLTRTSLAKSASVNGILVNALKEMSMGRSRNCDFRKGLMCLDTKTSAATWLSSYAEIVEEARNISLPASLNVSAVLDDLIHELTIYRENVKEPRLALVLSGGGAKCAYQAGAIRAITDHLNELRTKNKELRNEDHNHWVPEIKLVVGTSGGAINALFYALGRDDKLEETWRSFEQKDLIRPSAATRMLWGFCAGVSCVFVVFLVCLPFRTYSAHVMSGVLLCFAILLLVGANLTIRGLYNHWLYHDILLLRLSLQSGCLVLVTVAILIMLRPVRHVVHNHFLLVNVLGALLSLSMLALAVHTLFFSEYFTDLSGAKEAFIHKFPELVPELHSRVKPADTVDAKLTSMSQAITSSSFDLKRDLILTASRLPADNNIIPPDCPSAISGSSLPNDLYFYYDVNLDMRDSNTLPNKGDRRFISLRENPYDLLHIVLGSSTIYPFFAAQRLDCLEITRPERSSSGNAQSVPKEQIRSVDIVDGGYSHNSPVEAAISWGATHILLIQASPHPRYERPHSLLTHMFSAFNYLFDQAQRTDSSAKGNVEIFELAPSFDCDEWFDPRCTDRRQEWLDLLDFADPLLGSAFEHGQFDVRGDRPFFTRIPGPPSFIGTSKSASRAVITFDSTSSDSRIFH